MESGGVFCFTGWGVMFLISKSYDRNFYLIVVLVGMGGGGRMEGHFV